jgi:uncharacterized protein (UPF0261 family)
MANIAVLGTYDTKGVEHRFVADLIKAKGHSPVLIDVGTQGKPIATDVARQNIVTAGGSDLREIEEKNDRGFAVEVMSSGAPIIVSQLVAANKIHGIISLGGSGGTAIATAAMRALPIGFPKVMVSTMAAGNVAPYVGQSDIVMIPSVVDVAGINRISRRILTRATGAVCGMVETEPAEDGDKPLIAASMFGNTTDCVNRACKVLEEAGYEVLVFHATGSGGRSMESLIASGMIAGVLDITTTEWADEFLGGILTAGPERLEAAARHGVPAIVAPGCLDMVNFGPPETVPEKFRQRKFYQHNPQVTLMRTTAEECSDLARLIADKVNLSTGPVSFMIPAKAISVISGSGQRFHDPIADKVLFQSLRAFLRNDIPVREFDHEINDQTFAEECAAELLENIRKAKEVLPTKRH